MESRTLTFILLAMILLNAAMCSSGSSLPDEGYTSEDIDDALQLISDLPVKRGMCRSGFTYSAILRYCVPSLGATTCSEKYIKVTCNPHGTCLFTIGKRALRGRNGRRRY